MRCDDVRVVWVGGWYVRFIYTLHDDERETKKVICTNAERRVRVRLWSGRWLVLCFWGLRPHFSGWGGRENAPLKIVSAAAQAASRLCVSVVLRFVSLWSSPRLYKPPGPPLPPAFLSRPCARSPSLVLGCRGRARAFVRFTKHTHEYEVLVLPMPETAARRLDSAAIRRPRLCADVLQYTPDSSTPISLSLSTPLRRSNCSPLPPSLQGLFYSGTPTDRPICMKTCTPIVACPARGRRQVRTNMYTRGRRDRVPPPQAPHTTKLQLEQLELGGDREDLGHGVGLGVLREVVLPPPAAVLVLVPVPGRLRVLCRVGVVCRVEWSGGRGSVSLSVGPPRAQRIQYDTSTTQPTTQPSHAPWQLPQRS